MSWILKKCVFGSSWWKIHNRDFQQPQCLFFQEKYDELPESVAFGQKLMYFTDQNGPWRGGRPHKNEFWVFSNAEMNLTNNCSGKSRWKKWGYLPSFFPELESLHSLKKPIFRILCWSQQEICKFYM